MQIIGVTGIIGSGKTTFADFLASQAPTSRHYESWLIIAEVANGLRASGMQTPQAGDLKAINEWLTPLAELVHRATQQTIESVIITQQKLIEYPEHYHKLLEYLEAVQSGATSPHGDITESTKESCRSLLQWLGGFLVATCSPTIWYDEIIRRIAEQDPVTLVTIGGVRYPTDAACITNAGGIIIKINRQSIAAQDTQDLTERQRSDIIADIDIENNGTLQDLQQLAQQVYTDLQKQAPQSSYSTAQ